MRLKRAASAVRGVLRSPVAIGALLSLALAFLCALERTGTRIAWVDRLERASLDERFRWRGPVATTGEVVIVAVDDETLARRQDVFERRAGVAALIRAIADAEPRAIGVDQIFTKPEELLSPALIRRIRERLAGEVRPGCGQCEGEALLREVGRELDGDQDLAAAIEGAAVVVLGLHLTTLPDEEAAVPPEALRSGRYGQVDGVRPPSRQVRGGRVSLPEIAAKARGLGCFTVEEDFDRSVREVPAGWSLGDDALVPFSVQVVAASEGLSAGELAYLGGSRRVQVGERKVPLTADETFLLNFRGPAETFVTISAARVVAGEADEQMRGKIVLIGVTSLGHDVVRSPFALGLPGVELQATAVDTILAGDALVRAGAHVDVAVALLSGLLVSLLFAAALRLGPLARIGGVLAVAAVDVGAAWWAFAGSQVWLGLVWPLLTVALVGAVTLGVAYASEALQRVRLRRAFAHYLGAEALDELLADPGALALGGARRELTVLFSDIRDFTSVAERLSPEELVALLNTYLTPMTQEVMRRAGYLDKYIGDAVMAVFGAPALRQDHAARGLATAIAMHAALERLRPELARYGAGNLQIGVGVNTGEMVVGNMGSADRFDYTAVGDAVNLASRLEGLTKVYGVFCLVGAATRAAAPAGYRFRAVDLVRVKGKARPTEIFELLGGPEGELARYVDLERYEEALGAYRRGAFAAARAAFGAFQADNPADPVARLYLERLRALGDEAPAGWDGVVAFTHK